MNPRFAAAAAIHMVHRHILQNTECIMLTQTQLSFGNDYMYVYQRTERILAALKAAQPHGCIRSSSPLSRIYISRGSRERARVAARGIVPPRLALAATMAGVERFSKTARNYDSNKSPTLDPTVNACRQLPWVRPCMQIDPFE